MEIKIIKERTKLKMKDNKAKYMFIFKIKKLLRINRVSEEKLQP